jgi:hypothetical protein
MHHAAVDEIRAFELATEAARARGWPWRPLYWINLEDEAWEVTAASDDVIRIHAATGDVLPAIPSLDPVQALSVAREFALAHALNWKPAFSLTLERAHWDVGSCQSQLGGQVSIRVSHEGIVVGHDVNPK